MTDPLPRPLLSEATLESLLTSAGIGMAFLDRELRFVYASPALESIDGHPIAVHRGRTVMQIFPSIADELEPMLRGMLRDAAPVFEQEHSGLTADRPEGWRTWLGTYLPVVEDDQVWGIALLIRDVTARKREERLLRAQEAVHRIVATASSVEEALPTVLEAIGRSLGWEFGSVWFFNEREGALRNHTVWRARSDRGAAFEAVTREIALAPGVGLPGRVWSSGQPAWVTDVVSDPNFPRAPAAFADELHGAFALPIWGRDRVLGVLEFFTSHLRPSDRGMLEAMAGIGHTLGQLIERQTAEAALRASEALKSSMLATALDCIVSMDHEGRIVEFNPAAERTFGYRREDALGQMLADLIVPASLRERHREGLKRYLETGEGPVLGRRVEMPALCADGSEIPVELAITRIAGPGPPIFTAYLRDIRMRRQAEIEREVLLDREQAAREEAETANRSKDDFLATLSHELRTPLSAVLGWTVLLRTGQLPSHLEVGALEAIERNARAQAQLIEDLLDVSRIVAGKLRLDLQPLAMKPVVEAALAAVRPTAESKRIALGARLADAGQVRGDSVRLEQVVWNLLSNAVKFTPAEGRVDVDLAAVDGQITVVVRDTGIGLSADFLPHAFERLRQADPSTGRTGLGIGLSLVKHLVEIHEGTVTAESEGPGRGATFTVRLPQLSPGSAPEPQGSFALPPAVAGIRVLCVDDDLDNLDLAATILGQAGAEARRARSTAEALAILEAWMPDVIVSDIEMPGEDGYQLLRRVRTMDSDKAWIPAIALTAHGGSEDRARVLAAGFQVHIHKPIDPAVLVSAVGAATKRS